MGLRCLLGHDFDEPELRREREEDGDEVVTTVTEVKTCARCGETQIVSENTEVTTMEQLTDEAAAGADAAIGGPVRNGETPDADVESIGSEPRTDGVVHDSGVDTFESESDIDPAGVDDAATGDDDAVILDDTTDTPKSEAAESDPTETDVTEGDPASTAEDEGAELLDEGVSTTPDDRPFQGEEGGYEEYPEVESAETPTSDEKNAETDDGVILDEEAEPDADRERGAWPEVDADEGASADPTPWPEREGEDEGFSAEVGDDDGGAVEFGGGLTPEVADGTVDGNAEDAEYVEAPEHDPNAGDAAVDAGTSTGGAVSEDRIDEGTEITRGESPDLGPSTSNVMTEYYCPECEMTRDADGNSMRAGDICPECKRGYVNERPI